MSIPFSSVNREQHRGLTATQSPSRAEQWGSNWKVHGVKVYEHLLCKNLRLLQLWGRWETAKTIHQNSLSLCKTFTHDEKESREQGGYSHSLKCKVLGQITTFLFLLIKTEVCFWFKYLIQRGPTIVPKSKMYKHYGEPAQISSIKYKWDMIDTSKPNTILSHLLQLEYGAIFFKSFCLNLWDIF